MKKGFTILELLVASLLLGMLMTILTMIFNQSSIAWRTGLAGLTELEEVREKVSDIRYKADTVYEWKGEKFVKSIFDENGKMVTTRDAYLSTSFGKTDNSGFTAQESTSYTASFQTGLSCGSSTSSGNSKNYVISVMSSGPDRSFDKTGTDNYDNIYSNPNDPNTWQW